MPRQPAKPPLVLTKDARQALERIAGSRTQEAAHVRRAQILLAYGDGEKIAVISDTLGIVRSTVYRTIDKALQFGWREALDDLHRAGRPASITPEAVAYVTAIASTSPKFLGSTYERWTTSHLTIYIRKHCLRAGHPSLRNVSCGTVSKILKKNKLKPHKIVYYLERRDPAFTKKMDIVLSFYKEVNARKREFQENPDTPQLTVFISFDEKPGIQAVKNTAPDLPPVARKYPCRSSDYEYVRLGTVSLLAGMDLVTGRVHSAVTRRHRSAEFVAFLKQLMAAYPKRTKFRILCDNHSAHISKETRAFLATVPNRFEFTFTPVHGSWLNIIESFFSKMSRSVLRGIRVESIAELKKRILRYIKNFNVDPIPFHWKYLLEEASAENKAKRLKNLSKLDKLIRSIMKDIA